MGQQHDLGNALEQPLCQREAIDCLGVVHGLGRRVGQVQQDPANAHKRRGIGQQTLPVAGALEPLVHEHRTQPGTGNDQQGQQGRPFKLVAYQQAQQDTVVAVQTRLAFGLGIVAPLRGEEPGNTAEQGATKQGGGTDQNGQQAQHAAQRMTLQENLAETVAQGRRPIRARLAE